MSPLLVAAALAVASQEPPSFGAEVRTVYVDVFVSRDGRAVAGLSAENFEVKDEGVRQRARLVGLDQVPVSAILAFDTSSSVEGAELRDLRRAGHAIAEGLHDAAGVALLAFDHEVRLLLPTTADTGALHGALDRLAAGGATSLWDALFVAVTLPMPTRRPVVVLFTDGDDTASWLGPDQVLEVAARADALLHVVGLERTHEEMRSSLRGLRTEQVEDPRATLLRRVAESTGGRFWAAADSDRLEETFLGILRELSQRYVLAYEPQGVEPGGEHEIEVRLRHARGKVRARRGYVAPR